jgi:hypothetical protein
MKNSGVILILAEGQLFDLLFHYIPNSVLLAALKNSTNVPG